MPVEIVVGFAVLSIGIMAAAAGVQRNRNQASTEAHLRRVQALQGQRAQEQQAEDENRLQAVAEAIHRDPSLAGDDSPETLRRLGEATAAILEEFRLKADLAEVDRQRQEEQRADAARQQADADRALRVAEAEAAKRIEAERLARMNPARRWILTHKMGTLFIAGALLVVSVLGVEFVKRAQESARIAAAAEAQAAADAAAAEAQAAADAARRPGCAAGTGPCMVGDPGPGGGIVFYSAEVKQPWGTYLEASPEYAVLEAPWCKEPAQNPVRTADQIGSGATNTKRIAAACPDSAAAEAASYRAGGLQDWFLPSTEELQALVGYLRKQSSLSSVHEGGYWSSSTVRYPESAWSSLIPDGSSKVERLNKTLRLLPIRAF